MGDNYDNYNYYDVMGEDHPFQITQDLGKLLGSVPDIINALKHQGQAGRQFSREPNDLLGD